jgi:hypothetical protein
VKRIPPRKRLVVANLPGMAKPTVDGEVCLAASTGFGGSCFRRGSDTLLSLDRKLGRTSPGLHIRVGAVPYNVRHVGLTHESFTSSYIFTQGSRVVPAWAANVNYPLGQYVWSGTTVYSRLVAGGGNINPAVDPAWVVKGTVWAANAPYVVGDWVMSPADSTMYRRLIAGTDATDPRKNRGPEE